MITQDIESPFEMDNKTTIGSFDLEETKRSLPFDINKIESGNGIKNMQRRAKEINAALIIEPEEGSGTNIQLNLKT